MQVRSLSHLADHVLLQALRAIVVNDRTVTVELLIHLAEVDERKLYLPAAQPSMYLYCVNELRMSESSALKRIHVARAARKFPALLDALAEGRLNLTAAAMLAAHLGPENAASLIRAASHRSKSELQHLLAELAPRADVPASLMPVPPRASIGANGPSDSCAIPHAPAHVGNIGVSADSGAIGVSAFRGPDTSAMPSAAAFGLLTESAHSATATHQIPAQAHRAAALTPVISPTPPRPSATSSRPVLAPLAPGRYELRCTLGQEAHDKVRYAQSLLGHAVPSGDLSQVLERAIDALVERLEKKCIAGPARTKPRRGKSDSRYVPVTIRRAVWQRDTGRCTFVGSAGNRCPACTRLEIDHVKPVARGGETTIANLRLRCRAHNQYEADKAFGAGFMAAKRAKGEGRRSRFR